MPAITLTVIATISAAAIVPGVKTGLYERDVVLVLAAAPPPPVPATKVAPPAPDEEPPLKEPDDPLEPVWVVDAAVVEADDEAWVRTLATA